MSYYLLTIVLFLAAYLLGAWAGCFLRRLTMRDAPAAGEANSFETTAATGAAIAAGTAAAATAAAQPAADRFSRALSGEGVTRPGPGPTAVHTPAAPPEPALPEPPPSAFEPIAPKLETIPERRPIERRPSESDQAAPVPQPSAQPPAEPQSVQATPVNSASETGVVSAEVIVGAAAAATAAGALAGGGTPSESPAVANATAADDLRLLQDMDDKALETLRQSGITSFARLAGLRAQDVKSLDVALGERGRVARSNWIEQAQMLASGRQTRFAQQRKTDTPATLAGAPSGDQGRPLQVAFGTQALEQPVPGASEHAAAVSQAPSPESTVPQPDTGTSPHVGEPAREDTTAAGLAAAAAAAAAAGLAAAATRPAAEEQEQTTPAQAAVAAIPVASVPPAALGAGTEVAADDLSRISGVTPEIARTLATRGVTSFAELAGWTSEDVARFEAFVGTPGRVARERWIDQARGFAGLPEASPPAAEVSAPAEEAAIDADKTAAGSEGGLTLAGGLATGGAAIAGLRSVRSEAYAGALTGPARSAGEPDDLKRIRGVGVLIEKKLNMLGVTTYEQVANWTLADIDRVSGELDFRGRIERENWVEQARILVAGGQTQFSRRFDGKPG